MAQTNLAQTIKDEIRKSHLTGRIWDYVFKFMVPVSIILSGTIISHEVRISTMESNNFTDHESVEMERRIIATMPPAWLKDDINEIKSLLRSMDARMRAVEQKVK